MMEAACAYFEATGKDTLLNVMLKNVDCIYDRFVTKNNHGCPGHPEVELALMKMYRLTGEKSALNLQSVLLTKGERIPISSKTKRKSGTGRYGATTLRIPRICRLTSP